MDDRIAVVHQDPSPLGFPFDMVRLNLVTGERLFDFFGNGFDLPGGGPAADHEVVGKDRYGGKIQNFEIEGFLFQARLNRETDYTFTVDEDTSLWKYVTALMGSIMSLNHCGHCDSAYK